MVFLTAELCKRCLAGPDKFWRIQQQLRFSWTFRGRKRNNYVIGYRYTAKALMYATLARKIRKQEMGELWNTRLDAAANEHGLDRRVLLEGLARNHIQIDRKVLTDLAIYEPRTFECLSSIAKQKYAEDFVQEIESKPFKPPVGKVRGLL